MTDGSLDFGHFAERDRPEPCYRPDWCTDLDAAPKGEDVLVSAWNMDRTTTRLMLGSQLFEPYERDPDDDDAQGGTFGEHDGEHGIWFWYLSDGEGQTDKKEIAAWAAAPKPFKPKSV